jgi:hypothetical protein
MLRDEDGTAKDQAGGAEMARLSAEQGSSTRESEYGADLQDGLGVAKDEALAAQYYKLSVDQGYTSGQNSCSYYLCGALAFRKMPSWLLITASSLLTKEILWPSPIMETALNTGRALRKTCDWRPRFTRRRRTKERPMRKRPLSESRRS